MNYNNVPIDWENVDRLISKSNRIALTTHENPDGDGLGSEAGLYHHLIELKKDVRIINYSPLPIDYQFLNETKIFEQYNNKIHDDWLLNVDLVIIFDVGDFKRTRDLQKFILKHNLVTLNIDHHPHPESSPFNHNVVDLSAAATGCMIFDYLISVRQNPLNKSICDGIYTAVMTDTGCFRYSNTDEKCHNIAIESLKVGVKTHRIYQNVYENSSQGRMNLLGLILSKIHYEFNGIFAWFEITEKMMQHAGAKAQDVEGFSDIARTIKGVEIAMMIMETGNDSCRINFRSKGKFTVNDLAKYLGGGGHAYAAGAKVNKNILSFKKDFLDGIRESIKKKVAN
tara:strand:- start:1944 stop:2963 length:1020 start_codon:yes stop_codon:yes gene_type:complete